MCSHIHTISIYVSVFVNPSSQILHYINHQQTEKLFCLQNTRKKRRSKGKCEENEKKTKWKSNPSKFHLLKSLHFALRLLFLSYAFSTFRHNLLKGESLNAFTISDTKRREYMSVYAILLCFIFLLFVILLLHLRGFYERKKEKDCGKKATTQHIFTNVCNLKFSTKCKSA